MINQILMLLSNRLTHDQLQANLDKALKLMPYLEADINRFIEQLSDDLERNDQEN